VRSICDVANDGHKPDVEVIDHSWTEKMRVPLLPARSMRFLPISLNCTSPKRSFANQTVKALRLAGTHPVAYRPCITLSQCSHYSTATTIGQTLNVDEDSSAAEILSSSDGDDDDIAEAEGYLDTAESDKEAERLWFRPEGEDTGIIVRNGLTRTKVPLILKEKSVSWYMCGPTVYDDAHIGHASCYVRFDVIRRILSDFFGLDVVLVMGITDIDDKIITRSKILGQTPIQIAKHFESRFLSDMRHLDVIPPTFLTRVSDFIPSIIAFVERIIENGHGYHSNGSVYFDVASFDGKEYPRLMKPVAAIDSQHESTSSPSSSPSSSTSWQSAKNIRVSEKKDRRDFALWKAAKDGEPGWESPWGNGRPGWHIECSAMGSRIFGSNVDLHSGGIDLIFPHHENEITQCHAFHSDCNQWVNYWLHAGHLTLEDDEVKMSKSLGNTVSIEELLNNYSSSQFRMFCLMSRYRSTMRFSTARMDKAVDLCHRISSFLHVAQSFIHGKHSCGPIDHSKLEEVLRQTKADVAVAFANDFDTPTAMIHVTNLVHEGYIQLSRKSEMGEEYHHPESLRVLASYIAYITRLMQVLGVSADSSLSPSSNDARFDAVMESLVDFRSAVREFALATPSTTPLSSENDDATKTPDSAQVKKKKKEMRKERQPLLEACDSLRDHLAAQGLQIVDQSKDRPDLKASWKKVELNVASQRERRD